MPVFHWTLMSVKSGSLVISVYWMCQCLSAHGCRCYQCVSDVGVTAHWNWEDTDAEAISVHWGSVAVTKVPLPSVFTSILQITSRAPNRQSNTEKSEKYKNNRIFAKNVYLFEGVVSVRLINPHRLNQKVSYLYDKIFRLRSIEW
jgi:hypothetical protein